jgi:hypothetical protein
VVPGWTLKIPHLTPSRNVNYNFVKPRLLILLSLLVASINSIGQNNSDTLFVFVGKKISTKMISRPKPDKNQIVFYIKYRSKYEVLENVYNQLENRVVEFYDFSHTGMRELSTSKNALLFIYKSKGKFYHIRFQQFDVYKTVAGRWASFGDPFYFDEKFRDSVKTKINIAKIDCPQPVTFKINSSWDSLKIKEVFPAPYFKVHRMIATGHMGCYVEDLFIVKKEGILKQLGYFK